MGLVLVRDHDFTHECQAGEKLSGCDHHLIRFKIKTDHQLAEHKSKTSDYRRANLHLARELLTRTTWDPMNSTPVDSVWNGFNDKLLEAREHLFQWRQQCCIKRTALRVVAGHKWSATGVSAETHPLHYIRIYQRPRTGITIHSNKICRWHKGGWECLHDGYDIIQRNLDQITQWSEKWQMLIYTTKCKVIHIVSGNSNHTYHMDGEPL